MKTIPKNAIVLMVGPSGAGKSTITTRKFSQAEVLESDSIRIELFGTKDKGDLPNELFFGKVFSILNTRLETRTRMGLRSVIDATNLKFKDRQTYRMLAEKYDVPLVYVVFNRPLEDKIKTQGWREGQMIGDESLVVAHDRIFKENEPMILAGDGMAMVIDARIEDFAVAGMEVVT